MSATRDFGRWAREMANDPRYPVGLAKDEGTVALYILLTEAMTEAASGEPGIGLDHPFSWMALIPPCHQSTH